MSSPPSIQVPWSARLLWAGLGSAITAVIFVMLPDKAPTPTSPPETVKVTEIAQPDARLDVGSTNTSHSTTDLGLSSSTGTDNHPISRQDLPIDVPVLAPSTGPGTPSGDPPEWPFPRMPGTQTLRRTQRHDPEHGVWVLSHAVEIPAPASVVESFYRKALEDLGLAVSRAKEPPRPDKPSRVVLKGRRGPTKAQVAVEYRDGVVRTKARIIWRTPA